MSDGRAGRRLLALVVPEMHTFFFPALLAGVERAARAGGYAVVVCQSDDALAGERRAAAQCAALGVDGVLLALSSETTELSHLDALRGAGVPVVLLDKTLPAARIATVGIDDAAAGADAAAFLLARGHRVCLGVFGDQRQRICAARRDGFRRAHAERGVALGDDRVVAAAAADEAEALLDAALDRHPDATAVFAMSDELLVRAHRLLARRGARVPDDVSLLAISDGQAPAFLHPPVTHYRHAGAEVGERAARFLLGMVEQQYAAAAGVQVALTLVDLGSVRALA